MDLLLSRKQEIHVSRFSAYPNQQKPTDATIEGRLISVPTGAGTNAAAVLAGLYSGHSDPSLASGFLIYVLPMWVLVEQIRHNANSWIGRIDPSAVEPLVCNAGCTSASLTDLLGNCRPLPR